MRVQFDHFYAYDELTETLEKRRELPASPLLLSFRADRDESYEGRDIWLAPSRTSRRGRPTEKPGFWVDANIHALEFTGATAALYLLDTSLRLRRGPAGDACCSTRARSTSSRVSIRTVPSWRWPTAAFLVRAFGRIRARSERTVSPRGRRRRRTPAVDAHRRSERIVEGASGRAATAHPADPDEDVQATTTASCPRG